MARHPDVRPSAPPSPVPVSPSAVPPEAALPARRPPISEAPILDDSRQLPAHRGKVGRIADHVKGAAESLTEWIELRIALLKREVRDEIESATGQVKALARAYGIAAVLALLAGLILLLMVGFLLSALWGLLFGPLWALTLGFLTLGLVLLLGALIFLKRAERKQQQLPLFGGRSPGDGGQQPAA